MGGSSDGSNDSTIAVSAASRAAVQRARMGRGGAAKKRSGSLALTAFIVVAVLVGMLWAMIALAP